MKNCPVCRIVFTPLLIKSDTVIDYCKRCHGVWFDAKELEAVHREDPVLQTMLKFAPVHAAPLHCSNCSAANARTQKKCRACNNELRLDCPSCLKALHEVTVGTLTADRCEKCRGVWLDGGELEGLFREFHTMLRNNSKSSGRTMGDAASAAGNFSLDALIWAPDLVFYTAYGVGRLAAGVPEAAIHAASNLPEVAAGALEASTELAGTALEAASGAAEGLGDLFSSFLELLAGLFD